MSNPSASQVQAPAEWAAIRIAAGYKKAGLARRLGVATGTVHRFEAGDPIMGETTRARLSLEYRKLAAETAATMALPLDGGAK
jgi:DNA-binding XRE family transcriptional regulator